MIFPSQLSAMLTGMQTSQTPAATTTPAVTPAAQPPVNAGILSSLLGPQTSGMLRAMALGAGNIQQGADPFVAFGQGLGGAQAAYQARDDKARAEALEREKVMYQQQQDALANARADKSLSLQEQNYSADNARASAAEQRQALNDELYRKKVEADIEQMSRRAGLTPADRARADDMAAKEARDLVGVDIGGKILDPAEYERIKAKKKQEIIQDWTAPSSPNDGPGISGDPAAAVPTATGPNGEKVKLVNGQWVPA